MGQTAAASGVAGPGVSAAAFATRANKSSANTAREAYPALRNELMAWDPRRHSFLRSTREEQFLSNRRWSTRSDFSASTRITVCDSSAIGLWDSLLERVAVRGARPAPASGSVQPNRKRKPGPRDVSHRLVPIQKSRENPFAIFAAGIAAWDALKHRSAVIKLGPQWRGADAPRQIR